MKREKDIFWVDSHHTLCRGDWYFATHLEPLHNENRSEILVKNVSLRSIIRTNESSPRWRELEVRILICCTIWMVCSCHLLVFQVELDVETDASPSSWTTINICINDFVFKITPDVAQRPLPIAGVIVEKLPFQHRNNLTCPFCRELEWFHILNCGWNWPLERGCKHLWVDKWLKNLFWGYLTNNNKNWNVMNFCLIVEGNRLASGLWDNKALGVGGEVSLWIGLGEGLVEWIPHNVHDGVRGRFLKCITECWLYFVYSFKSTFRSDWKGPEPEDGKKFINGKIFFFWKYQNFTHSKILELTSSRWCCLSRCWQLFSLHQ